MASDLPARSVGPADAECARCREALATFDGLCDECNEALNDEIGDRQMERERDCEASHA